MGPTRKIIAIGHTALDSIYRIAAFPKKPTKVRALEHVEAGGGSAANAAVAIARLGGEVQLWSRIGSDEAGQRALAALTLAGVDTKHIREHVGSRTSTSVIIVDNQGEALVVCERDHAMPGNPGWLPLNDIASAGAVLSDTTWHEATSEAFRYAATVNVPTILDIDVAGGLPSREILENTSCAIASAGGLELITHGDGQLDRLGQLIEKGIRHAGVTLGRDGYLCISQNGAVLRQEAFKEKTVDTTGAGDAFHGGFAWALNYGLEDAECARVGAAVAALNCRRLGARAGLPTFSELDRFLKARSGRGITTGILRKHS